MNLQNTETLYNLALDDEVDFQLRHVPQIDQKRFVELALKLGLVASKPEVQLFVRDANGDHPIQLFPNENTEANDPHIFDIDKYLAESGLDYVSIMQPNQHAAGLIKELHYRDGKPLMLAQEETQRQAQALIANIAKILETSFPSRINDRMSFKLKHIHEGVVVIQDLTSVVPMLHDILDLPRAYRFLEPVLRMYADVNGMVAKPYTAIILNDSLFSRFRSAPDRQHAAAHETLHVICEGNLPMLLDEAATDYFADRVLNIHSNSDQRMSGAYVKVSQIWRWIVSRIGEDLSWQGYAEPAVGKILVRKSDKRSISFEYVSSPFHDSLKEILGEDTQGRIKWNLIMELIANKQVDNAFKLLPKGEIPFR